MKPKFGVRLPVSGPLANGPNIIKIGTLADELGFYSITTHDHVSFSFAGRYHHSGGMSEAVDERIKQQLSVTDIYETMTALSVLAGKTDKVKLMPSAAVLPWRHPVLFAKQAMTLQDLSGGRFVCPVVIGNLKSDFETMNVDYKKRGSLLDEYLEVLNLIFNSKGKINYKGKFITLVDAEFAPPSATKIPIWVGGSFTERGFARAVKYAEGFIPDGGPETYRRNVPKLKAYLKEHGKDPDEMEVGVQVFMSLSKDSEKSLANSRYTIESFFHGPEWDKPDFTEPSKSRRQVGIEGSVKNNFIGAPHQVIEKIEEYARAGVTFFDVRAIARTVEDAVVMWKLFASDVMHSF